MTVRDSENSIHPHSFRGAVGLLESSSKLYTRSREISYLWSNEIDCGRVFHL